MRIPDASSGLGHTNRRIEAWSAARSRGASSISESIVVGQMLAPFREVSELPRIARPISGVRPA